jgi:molybdate/tungstate transport system ATP-binding protein
MSRVKIKNVSKEWKEFDLKNIDLDIDEGEYFVLLGPTGAGKTLLLETIAGFHLPDSGSIWLDDRDVTFLPPERRNIGFIYQNYSLFPHLTVRENIEYGIRVKNLDAGERKERTSRLLELISLEHLSGRYPRSLSGGEQQKVAIARALAVKPKLLLLDEPLSSLDPESREKLRDSLKSINQEFKLTMIHVTHDRGEALSLGERLGVMMGGKLKQVGVTRDIFDRPSNEEVAGFMGVDNVFDGYSRIERNNGIAKVDLCGLEIEAVTKREGKVKVFIKPEDITILKDRGRTSARNLFEGKIQKITDFYPMVKLNVLAKKEFYALVTKRSVEELNLKPGSRVYISFKASAVVVV